MIATAIILLTLCCAYLLVATIRTHQRICILRKQLDNLYKCYEEQNRMNRQFYRHMGIESGQLLNGEENPNLN